MDFFFILAIILASLNGLKIIILLVGICWQNRFNRKVTAGQIPQYNIINSECENNINKVNNSHNNINLNDNLGLNKNENNENNSNDDKYVSEKKKSEDMHQEFKIKNLYEKEYSSQVNVSNSHLMLNRSFYQDGKNSEIRAQKTNNYKAKNYPIFQFDEKESELEMEMKKDSSDFISQNNPLMPNQNKQDLYTNNDNQVNNNNKETERISYPFDSENNIENNNNKNKNNYSNNYNENNNYNNSYYNYENNNNNNDNNNCHEDNKYDNDNSFNKKVLTNYSKKNSDQLFCLDQNDINKSDNFSSNIGENNNND
jgi:hypothetical protein